MIDNTFIKTRLDRIQWFYNDLEEITEIPIEDLKKDRLKIYAAERIFQLLVDEILDINNHIILHKGLPTPSDFQSTFTTLAENNILPQEFADKFSPCVGLRNRLVHRYEAIDQDLELKTIYNEKPDFVKYVELILDFLKK